MKVLKFGGSSVANATNMSRVLDIVRQAARQDRIIVVCSAISGCTDALLEMMKCPEKKSSLLGELKEKHFAISSRLFSGSELRNLDSTLSSYFDEIDGGVSHLETYGELLSTSIIASKLSCEGEKVLWADARDLVRVNVDGRVDTESLYRRVLEMTRVQKDIRIFVIPGFIARSHDGEPCNLGRGGSDYSAALFAAAVNADALQIWTDVPGVMTTNPKIVSCARTISHISYDTALCMAEHGAKVLYAPTVAPVMEKSIPIEVRNTFDPAGNYTVISASCTGKGYVALANQGEELCLCAEGSAPDEQQRVILSLRDAGISPTDISLEKGYMKVRVLDAVVKEACNALHKEFFEIPSLSRTEVFIAGNGAVGNALKELIESGRAVKAGKDLHISAISSSHDFAASVLESAPRRSVFVDCTNSEDIYKFYCPLLEKGINIVSSNRRSLSVPYVEYAAMKQAALRGGSFLRYESTVGAALPILSMLNVCTQSGDRIESMEAVVSCTLNYILSSGLPFSEALAHAQKIGLTEKDPRADLEGKDALRKLLILAREAGVALEAEDVNIQAVSAQTAMDSQRFVASISRLSTGKYKAEINLKTVGPEHPAYWLRGTDNAIIIRSSLHPSPMVIQGAGEGARLAASSILNDILL